MIPSLVAAISSTASLVGVVVVRPVVAVTVTIVTMSVITVVAVAVTAMAIVVGGVLRLVSVFTRLSLLIKKKDRNSYDYEFRWY